MTFNTRIYQMCRLLMIALCFLPGVRTLHAQESRQITLTVLDRYGVAIPDVRVAVHNSDFAAQTDSAGILSCGFTPGDVFGFSHPDYLYSEIKLKKVKDDAVTVHLNRKDRYQMLDVLYGSNIRHFLGRFTRRTKVVSKSVKMVLATRADHEKKNKCSVDFFCIKI